MLLPAVTTTRLPAPTLNPFSASSFARKASTSAGSPDSDLYLWFSGSSKKCPTPTRASSGGA